MGLLDKLFGRDTPSQEIVGKVDKEGPRNPIDQLGDLAEDALRLGANGQPVAGAEVTIVHVESGTVSRTTTDASGRYNARGLRVGGPYTITITKDGGTEVREGVYLQLAEASTILDGVTTDAATVTAAATAALFTVGTQENSARAPAGSRSKHQSVEASHFPSAIRATCSIRSATCTGCWPPSSRKIARVPGGS